MKESKASEEVDPISIEKIHFVKTFVVMKASCTLHQDYYFSKNLLRHYEKLSMRKLKNGEESCDWIKTFIFCFNALSKSAKI